MRLQRVDSKLAKVVGSGGIDLLISRQVGGMMRPTRYFCNIVAWVKVPELCSGGPVLLDGDVANTKLSVLGLTASKHVSIGR